MKKLTPNLCVPPEMRIIPKVRPPAYPTAITPKANSLHSVGKIKMKKFALYFVAALFPLLGNSCITMLNEVNDHPDFPLDMAD